MKNTKSGELGLIRGKLNSIKVSEFSAAGNSKCRELEAENSIFTHLYLRVHSSLRPPDKAHPTGVCYGGHSAEAEPRVNT